MKTMIVLLAIFGTVVCAPAWAINKCTGADGKVAFQAAPCTGGKTESMTVRPSGGGTDAPQTDWKKKSAQVDYRLAIQAAIERHEPVIGMTFEQLGLAMGLPHRINTGEYKSGSTQQRIYERGPTTWYVYTDGPLVTAVQTSVSPSFKPGPTVCPSSVDIQAAETSASSITLSDAEKVERLKQIAEMRRCGK